MIFLSPGPSPNTGLRVLVIIALSVLLMAAGLCLDAREFSSVEASPPSQNMHVLRGAFLSLTSIKKEGRDWYLRDVKPVELPHRIQTPFPVQVEYSVPIVIDQAGSAQRPWSMCIPKISAQSVVWLDMHVVHDDTNAQFASSSWFKPAYLTLPNDLPAGKHLLRIQFEARPGHFHRMPEIYMGHPVQIQALCGRLTKITDGARTGNLYLVTVMGLIALLMGIVQRSKLILLFAMATAFWSVNIAITLGWLPFLEEQTLLWMFHVFTPLVALMWCLFGLRYMDLRLPKFKRALLALHAMAYLLFLFLPMAWWNTWLLSLSLCTLIFIAVLTYKLVVFSARNFSVSGVLLSTAFVFSIMEALWDILRASNFIDHQGFSMAFIKLPLLALAMGCLVIETQRAFLQKETRAGLDLRVALENQKKWLEADATEISQQREKIILQTERNRLVQDMHDGLGSQLVSASALLKSMPKHDEKLAAFSSLIDAALMDLRSMLDVLSISHSKTAQGDDPIGLMLGMLRHRLAPVFRSQQIQLAWITCELPHDFLPEDPSRLQLIRLLQEAFTNTIKHAKASRIVFTVDATAQAITLKVQDNGQGIAAARADKPNAGGHGMANMQARAAKLHALLRVESSDLGTLVQLTFPKPRPLP